MRDGQIHHRQESLEGPPIALRAAEIHGWLFSLDADADENLLDPAELARAARFQFDHDRRRFIAGRAARRRILARYMGAAPDALQFDEQEQGRPFLSGAPVNFNMSRSENLGLLAVADASVLGADIEAVKDTGDLVRVAADNFSATEIAALQELREESWLNGFYACWTRKEAVVKAVGKGLLMPLDEFDVSMQADRPARILRAEGEAAETAGWSLCAFSPANGFLAALASDIAAPELHLIRV